MHRAINPHPASVVGSSVFHSRLLGVRLDPLPFRQRNGDTRSIFGVRGQVHIEGRFHIVANHRGNCTGIHGVFALDIEGQAAAPGAEDHFAGDVNAAELLWRAKDKGVKLLSELDANRGIGLIERVKQGQGRPARIYVKRFAARAVPPPSPEPPADLVEDPPVRSQDFGFSEVSPSSEVLTSEKPKSGVRKIRSPEVGKTEVYFNRNNYPDNSYLYPSIHPSEPQMDGMDREERKEQVQENIGYIAFTGHDRETVDELVELITDVLCSSQATFRIGGTQFKSEIVKQRLSALQQSHIEYVLECMKNSTAKIHNIRAYLLTALYHAPETIHHYYAAQMRAD